MSRTSTTVYAAENAAEAVMGGDSTADAWDALTRDERECFDGFGDFLMTVNYIIDRNKGAAA